MPLRPLLATLLLLAGCGRYDTLSDLPRLRVFGDLWQDIPEADGTPRPYALDVWLYHDDALALQCPLLDPETVAEVDGVPIPMLDNGGRSGGSCDFPIFSLEEDAFPPDQETSTLVLEDETLTVTMEVTRLFAERTLALPTHPDGHLLPGDAATLVVTPETDTIETGTLSLYEGDSVEACDETEVYLGSIEGTVSGNTLDFVVPDDLALAEACLCLTLWVNPEIPACDGADECGVTVDRYADLPKPCVMVQIGE